MRRIAAAILTTLSLLLTAGAAGAEPPPEFGSDWDDPLTAAPPVDVPHGRSCEVQIVDHEFRNFDPFVGTFTLTEAGQEGEESRADERQQFVLYGNGYTEQV